MLVAAARDDPLIYTLALHPGTVVAGRYRVARVLGGSSAVAVTYLAWDQTAQEQVVIKEFLPRTFAGRAADGLTIQPHSAHDTDGFTRALRRFTRAGELLEDVAHPNIPRVRSHFAANGTAYLVLDYYDGKTAAEHVGAAGGRLATDRALALVMGVLQGVQALHSEGVIHGYVTPENILVTAESRPLVLAIGTTRHVVGQLKEPVSGFAPIEQYTSKDLGPWTDVYACGALLYHLATGATPPSALERVAGQMLPLAWPAASEVPPALARVMMDALALLPDSRPHSAEEFHRRLHSAAGSEPSDVVSRLERQAHWRRSPSEAVPSGHPSNPALVLLPEPELLDNEVDLPTATARDLPFGRLVRPDVGVAIAAAVIVLGFAFISGRGEGHRAAGDVAAAQPSPIPTQRSPIAKAPELSGARVRPRELDATSLRQPEGDGGRSLAEAIRQQGGSELVSRRAAPVVGVAIQSSGQPPQRPSASIDVARLRPAPVPDRVRMGPPTISIALATSPMQQELLPFEAVSDLRERLAHGKEQADFGEYATAHGIFLAALKQVALLSDRYAGTQALPSLKHDIEEAARRVLAACAAENAVLRKRDERALKCE